MTDDGSTVFAHGCRLRLKASFRNVAIIPIAADMSPTMARSPYAKRYQGASCDQGRGERRSGDYFAFFALAFFAAFFSGLSFAFSTFTATGVLAAIRIDRA